MTIEQYREFYYAITHNDEEAKKIRKKDFFKKQIKGIEKIHKQIQKIREEYIKEKKNEFKYLCN